MLWQYGLGMLISKNVLFANIISVKNVLNAKMTINVFLYGENVLILIIVIALKIGKKEVNYVLYVHNLGLRRPNLRRIKFRIIKLNN